MFPLACPLDVDCKRVLELLSVETGVDPLAGTAAVEAVQTDVETGRVVDAVEAEGAVFAVHAVGGLWWGDAGGGGVWAGCHGGREGRELVL